MTIAYSYDAGNKRIWRGDPSSSLDELDFWGGNQKLATYQISSDSSSVYFNLKGTNVYFGGKLVSIWALAGLVPLPVILLSSRSATS